MRVCVCIHAVCVIEERVCVCMCVCVYSCSVCNWGECVCVHVCVCVCIHAVCVIEVFVSSFMWEHTRTNIILSRGGNRRKLKKQINISYRVNFGIPWFSFNLTAIKTVAYVARRTARTRKYLNLLGYLLNGCRINNETAFFISTCKCNK